MSDELTPERIELWRKSFAAGASDAELGAFVELVRQTGLSPEARQIYLRKQWDKKAGRDTFSPLTGIDGYRLVADRTGKYAGNDDPVFDDEKKPTKATVTVYKLVGGIRCPFTASARWDQYFPGDLQGFMWKKMPHLMLGKCAEALALRKAFPAELSGLYTESEMEQASATATEPQPNTTPPGTHQNVPEELYEGTQKQKDTLGKLCLAKGVSDDVRKRFGKEILGKPMAAAESVLNSIYEQWQASQEAPV